MEPLDLVWLRAPPRHHLATLTRDGIAQHSDTEDPDTLQTKQTMYCWTVAVRRRLKLAPFS